MPINIVVPEVGESVVDARVSRWLKQPGDQVSTGEAVVELETDKIDVEVPAPADGVIATITHKDGDDVKIGEVLGTMTSGVFSEQKATPVAVSAKTAKTANEPAPSAEPAPAKQAADDTPMSPSARRRAREQGAEPAATPKPAASAAKPAAKPEAKAETPVSKRPEKTPEVISETRQRMSRRRATIAKRLLEAQQTAALLTTFNEVDMSAVQSIRAKQRKAFERKHGASLGITSFFVKAAVAALKEFPNLNAEVQDDSILIKHYYDIGIAIGGTEGLVVPVIRNADRLSFEDVELAIRELADRAGNGKLTLDDLRGGTFSITNGGRYGSLMSTPIVNPPQVGILGLHTIKDRPVAIDGQLAIRPMMYIALTYDHRIVDGETAVQFLVRIKDLIEDPGALLLAM
jgi:2-oxoglutarate dehydrogenase E2 component (dihydrolipoamide succinyltransferase)